MKRKEHFYLHNFSTNDQRFAWSQIKQKVQNSRWLGVFKEQLHAGPLGMQLNLLEVFIVIQCSLVQCIPSCQKVAVWAACRTWFLRSNVNVLSPARGHSRKSLWSLPPHSCLWSSIRKIPSEVSSACLRHPTPRKTTTPALCTRQTLSKYLLYTKYC